MMHVLTSLLPKEQQFHVSDLPGIQLDNSLNDVTDTH
jgi:hypothetical protein